MGNFLTYTSNKRYKVRAKSASEEWHVAETDSLEFAREIAAVLNRASVGIAPAVEFLVWDIVDECWVGNQASDAQPTDDAAIEAIKARRAAIRPTQWSDTRVIEAKAEFIANAPTTIDTLLARVEAQDAEIARLEAELALQRDGYKEQRRMFEEWLDDMGYPHPSGWEPHEPEDEDYPAEHGGVA